MKLNELVNIIHRLAPPHLAADWDNFGLATGSLEQSIEKIGLALDATLQTVAQAEAAGCNLLLTHHPLIFKPIKNLDGAALPGAVLTAAMRINLAIFSVHTNWDAIGMASALADLLELREQWPLEAIPQKFYKLVVFVPIGYEEKIKKALFRLGAGSIGNYDCTWFAAQGEGGFTVPVNGQPFIGQAGYGARTRETRLEMIIPVDLLDRTARVIWQNHPYEEPAFEFHPIITYERGQGMGIFGQWSPSRDFFEEVDRCLNLVDYKWAGPRPGRVRRVAIMPGSGASYLKAAHQVGAEVFITGDTGYHKALEAVELGLTLVDLGHFETEWPGLIHLAEALTHELERLESDIKCQVLAQTRPWTYEYGVVTKKEKIG